MEDNDTSIILIQSIYRAYIIRKRISKLRESVFKIKRAYRKYNIIKKKLRFNYYINQQFFTKEEEHYRNNLKENIYYLFSNKRNKVKPLSIFFTKICDFDLMIPTDECYKSSWGELYHQTELYYSKEGNSIQQIALGNQHTLLLSNKGTISSFGWNNYSQCGKEPNSSLTEKEKESVILKTIENFNEIRPSRHSSFVSISSGEDHSLVIDDNGVLWGFGSNLNGQLGIKNPKIVKQPTRINEFYAQSITCAKCISNLSFVVNEEGEGFMWPWTDKKGIIQMNPYRLKLSQEKEKIINISCGNNFVFLLAKSGNVYSMGDNNKYGQLGHQDKHSRYHPILVDYFFRNQEKINQMSCGFNHVIAKNINGKVFTWGMGTFGQLGQGSLTNELLIPTEVKIPKVKKIYQIASGFRSSYFLSENGIIYMCGYNGSIKKQYTPIEYNVYVKYPEIEKDKCMICRIDSVWNKSMSIFNVTFINIGLFEENKRAKIKNLGKLISLKWLNQTNSNLIMKEIENIYEKNN